MEVSEILNKLDAIKAQYQEIANKYAKIEYGGDCTVYIGSQMWYDELFEYMQENERKSFLYSCDTTLTDKQALEDHEKCGKLIQEAEQLLKKYKLDKLLIDGGVMYWIGALPEPYTSAY